MRLLKCLGVGLMAVLLSCEKQKDETVPYFQKLGEILVYSAQDARQTYDEPVRDVEAKPQSANNFPDTWPTQGTITSLFGLRLHPISHRYRFHSGVDIANFKNTEVLACADAVVKFAGHEGGYGNVVILDHGNGFETVYGHAEDLLVSTGELIKKGQLIASMGSTGVSTGDHLHFEIRFAGEAVDPTVFIK